MQNRAVAAAAFLKAIANDARLLILCELLKGERSVSSLVSVVGLSQSALSQHLAILRQHGLVNTRRKSQIVYYSLADPGVAAVIGALYDRFCRPAGDQSSEK
jgi:ArsR family transcriptional regulator, virulence genes transcriptional regulator